MEERTNQLVARPSKPTMLWDGDCSFCFRWIQRWRKATGGAVEYRPYQEALPDFPQVDAEECKKAVQLILPDGRVLHAAEAVLKSLSIAGRATWMFGLYQRSRLFCRISETLYRFVARNRNWLP